MNKSLLSCFLLLLLNTLVIAAVYNPHETTRIIRSNLREYYENVLDEVLSARGKDVLLSMGRMRPDRRGGVFETLQKESGAFGVHEVHSSCLVQLPNLISGHITTLHGYLLESVEPNLQELYPKLVFSKESAEEDTSNDEQGSTISFTAHDELVSVVYSLNQAMVYRLGEQIDGYDIFYKVAADVNDCNSKLLTEPKSKSQSLFSQLISWLFPDTTSEYDHLLLEKRTGEQNSMTKRFIDSHLDIVRQDMWSEFDARVNDLITSISQDIMDDE